jgi:hypothetical protein
MSSEIRTDNYHRRGISDRTSLMAGTVQGEMGTISVSARGADGSKEMEDTESGNLSAAFGI